MWVPGTSSDSSPSIWSKYKFLPPLIQTFKKQLCFLGLNLICLCYADILIQQFPGKLKFSDSSFLIQLKHSVFTRLLLFIPPSSGPGARVQWGGGEAWWSAGGVHSPQMSSLLGLCGPPAPERTLLCTFAMASSMLASVRGVLSSHCGSWSWASVPATSEGMTSGHSALSSALNTGSSGHARLPTASLTLPGAQGVCLPSLRPVGLHILHYCLPEARPGPPRAGISQKGSVLICPLPQFTRVRPSFPSSLASSQLSCPLLAVLVVLLTSPSPHLLV